MHLLLEKGAGDRATEEPGVPVQTVTLCHCMKMLHFGNVQYGNRAHGKDESERANHRNERIQIRLVKTGFRFNFLVFRFEV